MWECRQVGGCWGDQPSWRQLLFSPNQGLWGCPQLAVRGGRHEDIPDCSCFSFHLCLTHCFFLASGGSFFMCQDTLLLIRALLFCYSTFLCTIRLMIVQINCPMLLDAYEPSISCCRAFSARSSSSRDLQTLKGKWKEPCVWRGSCAALLWDGPLLISTACNAVTILTSVQTLL